MEDSPPLVVEAVYYDPIIFQWMNVCSGFKYIHEDQKHVQEVYFYLKEVTTRWFIGLPRDWREREVRVVIGDSSQAQKNNNSKNNNNNNILIYKKMYSFLP